MSTAQFDSLTKGLAGETTRRRALAGLGALALGGTAVAGLSRAASAQVSTEDRRRRCINRCEDHCGDNLSNRKCRNRCQRRCEDR